MSKTEKIVRDLKAGKKYTAAEMRALGIKNPSATISNVRKSGTNVMHDNHTGEYLRMKSAREEVEAKDTTMEETVHEEADDISLLDVISEGDVETLYSVLDAAVRARLDEALFGESDEDPEEDTGENAE